MRTPIIAGNWKMNLNLAQSADLATNILELITAAPALPPCEIVIAPNTLAAATIHTLVTQKTVPHKPPAVQVAVQDVYYEDEGAFTGKIAVSMLADLGLSYAIVGHSEQRQYFHETDETVNKKVIKLINAKITPIFCIGETLAERKSGKLELVLRRQLELGLARLNHEELTQVVIAYEPVWAIGTGVSATPAEAEAAHHFVRTTFSDLTTTTLGQQVRILYGGSVKPTNAEELLQAPNIDGALVGGASLDAESFTKIIFALT